MRNKSLMVAFGLALAACGGGAPTNVSGAANAADQVVKDDTPKPAAQQPAKKTGAPTHMFDTAAAAGTKPMVREAYQYDASGTRDPFKPYVDQVERGPELADLRLVAVLWDRNDPHGSIATFRDIGNDHRYTVSPGQRIGRISVVSVDSNTVRLRMDDFGTTREQAYSLRKSEDQKP